MAELNPTIEKLRTRVQLDPKGRAFAQLAEECRKAGFLDEALAVCRKGLPNHPDYVAALVTLGRTLLDLERPDEARVELEKAVEISPANLVANRALADLYFRMNLHSLALDRYRMVRELNPLDASAEELIAQCEVALPEPDEPTGAFAAPTTLISVPAPPAEEPSEPTVSLRADEIVPAAKETPPAPTMFSSEAEITPSDLGAPVVAAAPEPEEDMEVSVEMEEEEAAPVPESEAESEVKAAVKSFDELYDSQILPPKEGVRDQGLGISERKDDSDSFSNPQTLNPNPSSELSMTSETLAELYAKQGLLDKAARMYERLLIQSPENARYRERLETLRGGDPAAATAPAPPRAEPPPPRVASGEKEKLMADIAALRPKDEAGPRDRRVDTLKQWLHAVEQERKRA